MLQLATPFYQTRPQSRYGARISSPDYTAVGDLEMHYNSQPFYSKPNGLPQKARRCQMGQPWLVIAGPYDSFGCYRSG